VRGPADGDAAGTTELHFIHQDLGPVPMLSTIENLDLGRPLGRRGFLPAPVRSDRDRAERLLAQFDVAFDVQQPVAALTSAERTIVRALDGWSHEGNVLVLDEPTAALHGDEVRKLLDVVRLVAQRGAGVVYISHRLDEVLDVTDRVVALRDGRLVAQPTHGALDRDALVRMITGEAIADRRPDRSHSVGEVRLAARGVRCTRVFDADLEVRGGEVVGVTGLLGSGREQVAGALFGELRVTAGTISVDGVPMPTGSPPASIARGMAYVPADRKRHGAVTQFPARENLTLPSLSPLTRGGGSIDGRRERREAERWFGKVGLRPLEPERRFDLFSGGNQQKIVLARWLRLAPSVLLLDEPTQGVDVGAKAAIYDLVDDAAASGAAVLVASSDTKELAALCDRVIVMRDGRIVAEVLRAELSESRLIAESLGGPEPGRLALTFGSTPEESHARSE
jgi:ribose transport system ATP-binding protein